jgi:hypothetical protein
MDKVQNKEISNSVICVCSRKVMVYFNLTMLICRQSKMHFKLPSSVTIQRGGERLFLFIILTDIMWPGNSSMLFSHGFSAFKMINL